MDEPFDNEEEPFMPHPIAHEATLRASRGSGEWAEAQEGGR
jgi:hypothetical protein